MVKLVVDGLASDPERTSEVFGAGPSLAGKDESLLLDFGQILAEVPNCLESLEGQLEFLCAFDQFARSRLIGHRGECKSTQRVDTKRLASGSPKLFDNTVRQEGRSLWRYQCTEEGHDTVILPPHGVSKPVTITFHSAVPFAFVMEYSCAVQSAGLQH
jgi:hypothetical protein